MTARILVVEDDDASRMLVAYLLESVGYTVLLAENGAIGVRVALQEQPDLVLCDLQMPVMNGYEVVHALRTNPSWRVVPLVAVTAFSMPGDREKTLSVGFQDHLSKPITPETFVSQVEAFLPAALRIAPT